MILACNHIEKKFNDEALFSDVSFHINEHECTALVIRRNAIETGVNVLTSLDTAEALVTSLENTDANRLSLIDIATIARR